MAIKSQKDFPYLEEFKKRFKVDEKTIFAYDKNIYADEWIPPDILAHEKKHIEQQNKIGADNWIERYLDDYDFRIEQERAAFDAQVDFFKDRNDKARSRILCDRALKENYGF